MKKVVVILLILIILVTNSVMATDDNFKIKRGDEFLKNSVGKWEEVGNTPIFEVIGEFFQKGSPTLSDADKTRLIINLLIFSCIANVGIAIFISKKDKKEIDTLVNTSKDSEILNNYSKDNNIKMIKQVDNSFIKSKFINKVKNDLTLLEEARNLKNIEIINNISTKEFIKEQEKELQDNAEKGLVEKSNKLKIRDLKIVRFSSGKILDTIVIVVKMSKIQYWTNLEGDKVLKGNKKSRIKQYYKISYVRSKDYLNSMNDFYICPACGAKININDKKQFKCEYCGSEVLTDWTLNMMKQIK